MLAAEKSKGFLYVVPPRVSLEATLEIMQEFLKERSGGRRAMVLAGALFDAIGIHFGLYAQVNGNRVAPMNEAGEVATELECIDQEDNVVLVVEAKDRTLRPADVERTLVRSRQRGTKEILFTTPGIRPADRAALDDRIAEAFAGGQDLYVFDLLDFARSILALGGEPIRSTFLRKIGEHLDMWNTHPLHRRTWKKLLESL